MGTFARSWDLLGQSFAILKSDKELMWLPVISSIFCIFATVIICGSGLLFVLPAGAIPNDVVQQKILSQHMAPFIFVFYVVTYSLTVYFNVALVSIASDRLAGGHATLSDGLQLAWDRKWSIIQWALLAATIGMLLKMVERRAGFLGRLLTSGTGLIWSLASFFVAPVLAAQNMGPVEALYKSSQVFRKRWGEEVAGGFSFQLVFLFLALPGVLPPLMGVHRFGQTGLLIGVAISVIYWLFLGIAGSATRGIFVAALYRYAIDRQVPPGYRLDDLSGVWQPKQR